MTSQPVSISAVGMVNALGKDLDSIWKGLLNGDASGLKTLAGYKPNQKIRVGKVEDPLAAIPHRLKKFDCRNNRLIMSAYQQIKNPINDAIKKFGPDRIGVVMGSSTSSIESTESAYHQWQQSGEFTSTFDYIHHELWGVAEFVAELTQIQGPAYTISTACSSSAKAFASARSLIRAGICDAVLVGGADSLCRLTIQGFSSLEALSENPANSMSRHRDGFNIGEGAALFLIERGSPGIQLLGIGESSDAHHISAPDPEGRGAHSAMQFALEDAGLAASDIDYIHLHGTGTPLNDQMESRAVAKIFNTTPCSSSKGYIGHTLGASGAMGVGFCWLTLQNAAAEKMKLVPHSWDRQTDDTLPKLNLTELNQEVPIKQQCTALANSFGFGGSNCAVIIGRKE